VHAPGSVRLDSADVGCLWGMRMEIVEGQAFSLVKGLQPWDCKSIAKASKVRILHLPPRTERAPDLRKRRLGALWCTGSGYPSPLIESVLPAVGHACDQG
jgi:hypothetical protein